MQGNKKWYKSKAIWGSVIAVASLVAGAFGYSIGAEDQEQLTVALSGIGVAVGNILAVYGRVKAKDKLEK